LPPPGDPGEDAGNGAAWCWPMPSASAGSTSATTAGAKSGPCPEPAVTQIRLSAQEAPAQPALPRCGCAGLVAGCRLL